MLAISPMNISCFFFLDPSLCPSPSHFFLSPPPQRANPVLLNLTKGVASCMAIGGQDGTLSVWVKMSRLNERDRDPMPERLYVLS